MFDPNFQNHFNDIGYILNSIKGSSYFGIFLLSLITSYVFPLPEAVALMLIGFATKIAGFDLPTAIVVSIVGTVIGDNILYRLSFFGNKYVERFNKKMRANKLIQYEHLVADNIGKSLFFLRLVAGVRFFGPVIAGTLGVGWKKFFLYNCASTILHGIIFILLGFFVHRRIGPAIVEVEIIKNILLFSSVVIVGFLLRLFSKKA